MKRAVGVRGLAWCIALLVGYRAFYHAAYLSAVPFARATFSDGAVYERAARDLLAHPPLGSEPFYLQGLYAYLLALGLWVSESLLGGLVLQLLVACAALAAGVWALTRAFGLRAGLWSGAWLCAYFPLAFYENKYLSASLGVSANMLVWAALVVYARRRTQPWLLALGAAAALSVLARPNMLLAVPCVLWAALRIPEPALSKRRAAWVLSAGFVLALAPMAARNAVVTGVPTVFPAHGGGTSFYIGNNPHAQGRWNTAGGLLSGEVTLERRELLAALGIEPRTPQEDAQAIGRALYHKAFAYMRDAPGDWLLLQGKKLWLTLGNDELSQDYDRLGERELLPGFGWGVPFGLLLGLAALGIASTDRRAHTLSGALSVLLLGQGGAALAANLVYFTSSQHRLPVAVIAGAWAGPGLLALMRVIKRRREVEASPSEQAAGSSEAWPAPATRALVVALLLTAQAFVPRAHASRPSAAHYYNLFVVEEQLGHLPEAALALRQVLERKPQDPVARLELASLLRRMGQFAQASPMLEALGRDPTAPAWVHKRAVVEHALSVQGRTESTKGLRVAR